MALISIETTGESKKAYVNSAHVSYLSENMYGTSIHFDSGEYVITTMPIEEVSALIFGEDAARMAANENQSMLITGRGPHDPGGQ